MTRFRVPFAVAALAGTVAAVTFAPTTAASPRTGNAVTALPSLNAGIVARVNAVRASHGLRRLTLAPGLAAAARVHSRQMAVSGLFQHESPDGTPFWRRLRRFYGDGGFHSWSVGETLEWQTPLPSAAEVVSTWLGSPEHRQILLDPNWREIGVSAVQDTAAPGDFEGLQATIVTADFGVRSH